MQDDREVRLHRRTFRASGCLRRTLCRTDMTQVPVGPQRGHGGAAMREIRVGRSARSATTVPRRTCTATATFVCRPSCVVPHVQFGRDCEKGRTTAIG